TEEAAQIVELFLAGMGHAETAPVQEMQFRGVCLLLDDVVERLHQHADPVIAAQALIGRFPRLLRIAHDGSPRPACRARTASPTIPSAAPGRNCRRARSCPRWRKGCS